MIPSDITALVERLRKHHRTGTCMEGTIHLAKEAADVLESLALENERPRLEFRADYERQAEELFSIGKRLALATQELKNIANADTVEWDDPTQYEAWAKSWARHTLAMVAQIKERKS